MAKPMTVLGLMSGTSMDGVDAALLRTDGIEAGTRLGAAFTPYPETVKTALRAVLGRTDKNDPDVKAAEELVTAWHIRAVVDFLTKGLPRPDLIGFHGQTIFHDPAQGRTWQLGDGQKLADDTGIPVVYDFRSNDMREGGQGAPLMPLYHKALLAASGATTPACVLNMGGVANITWVDGDAVIACDTGPANALIDDWMLAKTGTPMDTGGCAALKGNPDEARITAWLEHPFFKKPAPKSLDRNAFAACSVADLSLEDGAATLAAFTVDSVIAALHLMPAMPQTVVAAGGGRHNRAIMQRLANHATIIDADKLGWDGDALEAEGFAYLAARSLLGLPLSLPATTGCRSPASGGILANPRKT